MTDELKTLIENQRKRRSRITAHLQASSPKRTKKKSYINSLFYILIGLVYLVGLGLVVWDGILTSRTLPSPILQAVDATAASIPETTPTETNVPLLSQVCTNVPDGILHVRIAPGKGSPVHGYLAEGETVQFALNMSGDIEAQDRGDGSLWVRLQSPIVGWVNVRYLCQRE